jgi:hypothetical protein
MWNGLKNQNINTMNIWLGDLCDEFGINHTNISVRGKIIDADYYVNDKDEEYCISLTTETAWVGCHEVFYKIRNLIDEDIIISYREMESGCEVYNVVDDTNYFTEECCVNCSGDVFGEDVCDELFDTTELAVEYWCECMNINWDKENKSVEEMLKLIKNFKYEDDNTYFYINEFTFH